MPAGPRSHPMWMSPTYIYIPAVDQSDGLFPINDITYIHQSVASYPSSIIPMAEHSLGDGHRPAASLFSVQVGQPPTPAQDLGQQHLLHQQPIINSTANNTTVPHTPPPPLLTFSSLSTLTSRSIKLLRHRPDADAILHGRLMDAVDHDTPITHLPFFLAEFLLLLITTGCLVLSLTLDPIHQSKLLLSMPAPTWLAMATITISGLSVIRFLSYVTLSILEPIFRLRRYFVFFTRGLKPSFDVTAWLFLLFLSWAFWFKTSLIRNTTAAGHDYYPRLPETVHYVNCTLVSLLLAAVFWFLKEALILKLEAELRFVEFFDSIRGTIIDLYGIRTIQGCGRWRLLKRSTAPGKSNSSTSTSSIWMDVDRMKQYNVPVWVLKRLVDLYLVDMEGPLVLPGQNEKNLIKEGQYQFKSVIGDNDREYIIPRDLEKYSLRIDEMQYVIRLFKRGDEHDDLDHVPTSVLSKEIGDELSDGKLPSHRDARITREEFLSWVVVAYNNCWGLLHSLRVTETAFCRLNRFLTAFLIVLVIVIWLLLSDTISSSKLALFFSPFLAATFVFGDTLKDMFEGLVFTFAVHPFSVGDHVIIDRMQMKVRKMNILTSVFFKYGTEEEVVYPNSLLASKNISNLHTFPDQGDSLEFSVDEDTPMEQIKDLQCRIMKYLDDEPDYSALKARVVKKDFDQSGKEINMVLYFKYLMCYLDSEARAVHRSRLLTTVIKFVKDMAAKKPNDSIPPDTIWRFNIDPAFPLEKINQLEAEIMETLVQYRCDILHSRVLLEEVKSGKESRMALYLCLGSQHDGASTWKAQLQDQIKSMLEAYGGEFMP